MTHTSKKRKNNMNKLNEYICTKINASTKHIKSLRQFIAIFQRYIDINLLFSTNDSFFCCFIRISAIADDLTRNLQFNPFFSFSMFDI